MTWQTLMFVQKSDAYCLHSLKSLKHKYIKTRKTLNRGKIIFLPRNVIVEIETSLAKLWVRFSKKILFSTGKASKVNPLTPQRLPVTLLLSWKSQTTEIKARLNAIPVTKRVIMLASAVTESQKTSVGPSKFCYYDWDWYKDRSQNSNKIWASADPVYPLPYLVWWISSRNAHQLR